MLSPGREGSPPHISVSDRTTLPRISKARCLDLVHWDWPDDPMNPTNWPSSKKWHNIILMTAITFTTYSPRLTISRGWTQLIWPTQSTVFGHDRTWSGPDPLRFQYDKWIARRVCRLGLHPWLRSRPPCTLSLDPLHVLDVSKGWQSRSLRLSQNCTAVYPSITSATSCSLSQPWPVLSVAVLLC